MQAGEETEIWSPERFEKRKKVSYAAAIERSAAAALFFANSANVIFRIKKVFLYKKERKARPVLGLGRESFEFREKNWRARKKNNCEFVHRYVGRKHKK